MLQINGKTFMNLQEAVQWLLDNNALPFQSSANYVANTEIGMGTIVNPSPAKVRIGSLIFFADSKVSTVIGLTENGFICSDQYNNLVDDIAYVTNVAINGSGHLITTLSDGQTIDAGQIKQVTGFSINASQHLIVSFNDGTITDLGAIFNGNVNISGNFTADSIIENMVGYTFVQPTAQTDITKELIYAGVVKNGNKITFVLAMNLTRTGDNPPNVSLGGFYVPDEVYNKLYETLVGGYNFLDNKVLPAFKNNYNKVDLYAYASKSGGGLVYFTVDNYNLSNMTLNDKYYIRYECTFLLSDNLAS